MNVLWPIIQVFTVFVETFIRWHVTHPKRKQRRIGYAVAIGAQFLWLAIFIHKDLYYMLPLILINGTIWARGLWLADNHIKKRGTDWKEISI